MKRKERKKIEGRLENTIADAEDHKMDVEEERRKKVERKK